MAPRQMENNKSNHRPGRRFLELDPTSRSRADRFPTVDERVRLYLGNWYRPPCRAEGYVRYRYNTSYIPTKLVSENPKFVPGALQVIVYESPDASTNLTKRQVLSITSDLKYACLSLIEHGALHSCAHMTKDTNIRNYCVDVEADLWPLMTPAEQSIHRAFSYRHVNGTLHSVAAVPTQQHTSKTMPIPIMVLPGDNLKSLNLGVVQIPHFKKYRLVADPHKLRQAVHDDEPYDTTTPLCVDQTQRHSIIGALHKHRIVSSIQKHTLQPILWKLVSDRHYGGIRQAIHANDIPWEQKRDRGVFWGAPTGDHSDDDAKSNREWCERNHRCRFVYREGRKPLRNVTSFVDAKLVREGDDWLPDFAQGVEIFSSRNVGHGTKSQVELLQYKVLIMLEGNDVSTGLKWALYSNSVVLIPPPTRTTWAMEELLQPWVHYVPIDDPDYGDVNDKMQWILNNPDEAKAIARHGRQWIDDLLYHPDAERDSVEVNRHVLQRYRAHFAPVQEDPQVIGL